MHDVFISYSSRDAKDAELVLRMLESRYIPCWMAPRDIPKGANYADEIPAAIRQAKFFVILVSRNSQNSAQVKNELNLATNAGLIMLPLRLDKAPMTDAFEYHLGTKQWTNAAGRPTAAIEELIRLIYDETRKMPKDPAAEMTERDEKNWKDFTLAFIRAGICILIVIAGLIVSNVVLAIYGGGDLFWKTELIISGICLVLIIVILGPSFGGRKAFALSFLEYLQSAFNPEKEQETNTERK